jgi:hypothetical protein
MRTARRHRHAIAKELEDGTLRLDPALPHADAFEAEVARRCALTDSRRGVWGQAARQRLHVTREADRVIDAVGQRVSDELDRRLPAPTDDIERMREEKRRLETAIRKATENKKLERAAERARVGETRQATGPARRKRPRL